MSGVYSQTTYVSFELSNICPYAAQHAACPISHRKEPKTILPMKTVFDVLADLRENEFSGRIGWNLYNEPLCDPRLYLMILQTNAILNARCTELFVLSNGYYLDQTIVTELAEIGVDRLRVSCYGKEELARISAFSSSDRMKFEPFLAFLDERLGYYEGPEKSCDRPCLAPLNEICIYSDGNVALCCLDYRKSKIFGNVKTEKLSAIVAKGEMGALRADLEKNIRTLPLCRRCGYFR